MTTAKRQTLADFLYYSICEGQKEMGPIGYSPLPINLVQAGFEQIGKLKAADPGVDLTKRDVTHLQQPDVRRRPARAATTSPRSRRMPPACDKAGAGPVRRQRRRRRPANPDAARRPAAPTTGAGTGSTGAGDGDRSRQRPSGRHGERAAGRSTRRPAPVTGAGDRRRDATGGDAGRPVSTALPATRTRQPGRRARAARRRRCCCSRWSLPPVARAAASRRSTAPEGRP